MTVDYSYEFIANALPNSLDEFGRSPLHHCCIHPAQHAIEILLPLNHFDVNHQDILGWTPLLCLLQSYTHENRESIQWITYMLLEYGANPNLYGPNSLTPLMIAVLNKDIVLLQLLLRYGADPNIRLDDAESLLPPRSSAFSLAVRPPTNPTLCDTDIHCIWIMLQYVSAGTIFHAIQKVNTNVKNVVLYLMDLKQSKL